VVVDAVGSQVRAPARNQRDAMAPHYSHSMASIAFLARFFAARTSCRSGTISSVLSPPSTTTTRRPCAARAASTYLQAEAHQPVAALDHDDLYVRIAEDSQPGFAAAIPARAGIPHRFHHPKTVLGGELRQAGQLPIQVRFLARGGNSGV
jgi:hypothetical protein